MQESFRRRRLPHIDLPGATYFVTACLAGSIPAQGLLEIEQYRKSLERQTRPRNITPDEWKTRKWKLAFARCDRWLDQSIAVRHLADQRLANEVVKSMYHFAGERYDLLAYVVMPSHFHWVFRPRDEWVRGLGLAADKRKPRERIMHSLNRFTARECNKLLSASGTFWQDESYDHCVRDEDELERIVDYVELNPVRAELSTSREAW
jgi:type I restriction enzyme R subunit